MNFDKIIEEQIGKVPRQLVLRVLREKIEEHGIEDTALIQALMDHLDSGSWDTFYWDDGSDDHRDLHLEVTDEDWQRIQVEFQHFLDEQLPEVIRKTVKDSAKRLLKTIRKRWPEQKFEERGEMHIFRDRLDLWWSKTLDPLRMMLTASKERGLDFGKQLSSANENNECMKQRVISALHARACQTTMEIIVLLENGLADGAFARWRTLYEITVVAFVVDKFGDDVAERYMAHDVVSMRAAIKNEYDHNGLIYDTDQLSGDEKDIEEEYQRLKSKFGKPFVGSYGWAADSLDPDNPRFIDLEKAIDWSALPPSYKSASFKVHAGVAGTVRSLGDFCDEPALNTGVSIVGLDIPATHAAYSLLQMTWLVSDNLENFENQIMFQSIALLRDKVLKQGRKAAKKLARIEETILSDFRDT